jgi:hypothetical protein
MEVTAAATLPHEEPLLSTLPEGCYLNNTVQFEMLHSDDHEWEVGKEVGVVYLKIIAQNFPG